MKNNTISLGNYKIVDHSLRNFNEDKDDHLVLEEDYGDSNPRQLVIKKTSFSHIINKIYTAKEKEDTFELVLIKIEK